jgi:streptogramin lyase
VKYRLRLRVVLQALALCGLASAGRAQNVDEFPVPVTTSSPRGLTAGPGQTVWYGTHSTRKIGRIDLTLLSGCQSNPSLCMTEYPIPNPSTATYPYNLAKAPDGTICFTEGAGKMGRVTFGGGGGNPTPTPTPTGSAPGLSRAHVTPLKFVTPKSNVNGRQ